MASTQLLDSLFTRLALGSSSRASSSSALASTSRRSYATQANLLGSLRPVKGAAVKVSLSWKHNAMLHTSRADYRASLLRCVPVFRPLLLYGITCDGPPDDLNSASDSEEEMPLAMEARQDGVTTDRTRALEVVSALASRAGRRRSAGQCQKSASPIRGSQASHQQHGSGMGSLICTSDTCSHAKEMTTLQIGKLAQWIRDNRIDPTKEITMKELKRSGAVHSVKEGGIKLLGNVSNRLDDAPIVQAS